MLSFNQHVLSDPIKTHFNLQNLDLSDNPLSRSFSVILKSKKITYYGKLVHISELLDHPQELRLLVQKDNFRK